MLNVLEDISMVNQINDSANLKPIDSDSRLQVKQQEPKKSLNERAASADVSFSTESKQLEALKASLRQVPEVDEDRVQLFKMELASGNYQIDSNKIVMSMLNAEPS